VTEGNGARGIFGKEFIGDLVEDVVVLVIGFVVVAFVVGVIVSAALFIHALIGMKQKN
jgi:hypothetical protein